MRSPLLLLALLCSVAACGRRAHESRDAFRWEEEIPPGTTIHLRTMTGRIDVVPVDGRSARVAGTTRWVGRTDPIHFAWTRDGNDVYVCALFAANGDCSSDSDNFGHVRHSWLDIFSLFKRQSTNAMASLRVSLPAGVKVDARTLNGGISLHGATSGVTAHTVNGSIDIGQSAGPIEAKGTNGSIEVALDSLAPGDAVVLESVNGSMTAKLPPSLEADVQLSTVNGHVRSDFPINTEGEISNRELHGQIGKSSREVVLRTVNGNVSLLKQGDSPPEPASLRVRHIKS
jgi:Putative adhesin